MYFNLLKEINAKDLTVKDFAKFTGMNYKSLMQKIKNNKDFTYYDIIKIVEFFKCQLSADYLFENI